MSINGILTAYYQVGYANVKPTNNTGAGPFKDTISEKAVSEKIDYDERAFEYLGPNAPDEGIYRQIGAVEIRVKKRGGIKSWVSME